MTSLRDTTADAAEAAMHEAARLRDAALTPVTLSGRDAAAGIEAVNDALDLLKRQRKTTGRDRDLAAKIDAATVGLTTLWARLTAGSITT